MGNTAGKRATGRRKRSDRLGTNIRPTRVRLQVEVDPAASDRFRGEVSIDLVAERPAAAIELHAADLRVSRARLTPEGARTLRGRITPDAERQRIAVTFDSPVPAGRSCLQLGFSGRLRKDLCGLYGASAGERRYAFTQLEPADARKFFPCFDEPAMKACFEVSVTTARDHAVVSNAPVARTDLLDDGRKTVHFEPTPPLSSYLVALAVGDLECSKVRRCGSTEIRSWHVPGKGHLCQFGLEAAAETLARLERYFDLPYPYAKLDLVAVPDFEFGAMENAGAVFFRETLLLLDPATATLAEHKRAAEVICHELAHMWYGNLVTMAWWDDLWLNEAFATWMAFHIVDDWKPEWKMWHDFQHHRAAALDLDALHHTHPIYTPVRTPDEANENFDLITYEKGASVVRMLERYLGARPFRSGVRRYIRRHREANAVASDLWSALSEASGEGVDAIVRAWIEREGYPALRVRRAPRSGKLELQQERFTEAPRRKRKAASHPAASWPVPWVGRVLSGGRGVGKGKTLRHLLTRKREQLTATLPTNAVVYGNADESGFFRPVHPEAELRTILARVQRLTPIERMGLVDHQWALARAGRSNIASLLDTLAALANDPDPDVLTAARRPLSLLANGLAASRGEVCGEQFRRWVIRHYGEPLDSLGWDRSIGEDGDDGLRRAALIDINAVIGRREDTLREAVVRCDAYLNDRRSLAADLADTVVAAAALRGSESLYQRFHEAMTAAATPQEERRFLLALCDFRSSTLVKRTLRMTLTAQVATQDVAFVYVRLFANSDARELTWDFLRSRWSRLSKRIAPLLLARVISATPALASPRHRKEVASFFREHPVPSGERALRQALERFDTESRFRRSAGPELQACLGARAKAGR